MMYSPLFFALVARAFINKQDLLELSKNNPKNNEGKANWADYVKEWGEGNNNTVSVKAREQIPTLMEKEAPATAPAPAPKPAPESPTAEPEPKDTATAPARATTPKPAPKPELKLAPKPEQKVTVTAPPKITKMLNGEKSDKESGDSLDAIIASIDHWFNNEDMMDQFFLAAKKYTNAMYQNDPEMKKRYENAEAKKDELLAAYGAWASENGEKNFNALQDSIARNYPDFFKQA